MRVGFLGLGVMEPTHGFKPISQIPVMVWNRTASKYALLGKSGVHIGETPAQVAENCDVIFTMLFDDRALRSIFDGDLKRALRGKMLVNSSSVSLETSQVLAEQVQQAGGHFIGMPVSGSKVTAEQGQLVGMLAGDRTATERIRPFLDPITSAAICCGPIGMGLKTKFAVNLFLITMTAGLAEATNLARAQGLDLNAFSQVLEASPMVSTHSRLKIAKMLNEDWSAQAALEDCYNLTLLIKSAA